ncbi:hypothetical protein ACFW9F_04185 [Streptomyces sp. NPDC059506]|uniref:hypothetical protein n=1 Tax=Streptomyces TaxID=1883 RepID=UPI0036A00698
MTDIPVSSDESVHESYSFACMRCGYGWEQEYDIKHHPGAGGRTVYVYYTDGVPVPSPLTRPMCVNCGSQKVRILQAGSVAKVPPDWPGPEPARGRPRSDGAASDRVVRGPGGTGAPPPGARASAAREAAQETGAHAAGAPESGGREPEEEGHGEHRRHFPHFHLPHLFRR